MFDPIGSLYHHTNPLAEECLASLPLRGWPAKHVAQLSPVAEGIISHFQPNSYYCTETDCHFRWREKWVKNLRGDDTFELPKSNNAIYITPAKHFGYAIFVKSDRLQNKRSHDYHHVLTTADTSEAIIVLSSISLAKKLAIPLFQRAWVGNCGAPMPSMKLRPLPYDYWQHLYSDDIKEIASMPSLECAAYNFKSHLDINHSKPAIEQRRIKPDALRLNLGGMIMERMF